MPEIPHFVQEQARVLSNQPVAKGIYLMRLEAPAVSRTCQPAQFVQILTDPGLSPFLRRPFSALRVDRDAGWFEIIYDVIGPGTERMAVAKIGDEFDINGPLGQPFVPPNTGRLLLVGGGVGLVPLAFLAWAHPERRNDMVYLMGAANGHRMPDMAALLPQNLVLHLATDDGSVGHKGFVTQLIAEHVVPNTTVITCGPHAMMAQVAKIAGEMKLPCFASLENHMACGFGACMGCVVAYKEATTPDLQYRRVCLEGPMVNAHAIVW